jgi:hypothetical protein
MRSVGLAKLQILAALAHAVALVYSILGTAFFGNNIPVSHTVSERGKNINDRFCPAGAGKGGISVIFAGGRGDHGIFKVVSRAWHLALFAKTAFLAFSCFFAAVYTIGRLRNLP